ncbi:MAG: Ribosomal RNA small subunit methyltransferase E [Desulfovibrio sp.]
MRTFFLPASGWQEPYQVTGAEARHLVTVLRIKLGEEIRLLDGEGREGIFSIAAIAKKCVTLTPVRIITHERPADTTTLAVGYGRSIRRGWLLEKAVELESAGIWFWQAERSQGKVPEENKETWLAQMTAGAKQSNNPYLPELRTLPGGVAELIREAAPFDKKYILWEGDTKGRILSLNNLQVPGNALFVLGPEGGFAQKEVDALIAGGFTPLSLGNRVLRWETAALLCLGLSWWARQQCDQ